MSLDCHERSAPAQLRFCDLWEDVFQGTFIEFLCITASWSLITISFGLEGLVLHSIKQMFVLLCKSALIPHASFPGPFGQE